MIRRCLKRHDVAGTARYLTFSCHRRLPLLGNARIRDRFVERLIQTTADHRMAVLAWVVMPDHVHAIVLPQGESEGQITRFVHSLKRPFAREVPNRWRSLDAAILKKLEHGHGHRFWQAGGGYDRNVIGLEFREKIRYVNLNPLRAGLVERSIDWPWSSARAYESLNTIGPHIAFDLVPRGSGPLT